MRALNMYFLINRRQSMYMLIFARVKSCKRSLVLTPSMIGMNPREAVFEPALELAIAGRYSSAGRMV